jgi:hypothetical protein
MVDFGHNYFHAMDKDPLEKVDLSTKDVGVSMGIGDPWTNIKASVSAGASTVELGFMGTGKGSISSPTGVTPETIGRDKREDIRMMAKLNDIKLSTHAAAGITGVTGLSREGRGFSDMAAQNTVIEIERAIDFAADTAGGGAVVFHVGEFPRDVTQFKEFQPKYGDWEKEEVASLVNQETGQLVQFQKGQVLLEPVWAKNKNDEFVDGAGKVISKEQRFSKGVPLYDKNGKVQFQEKRWQDFEKEAKELNEKNPDNKTTAAKLSFIASQRSEVDRSAPFAFSYMREYENGLEDIKDLERIRKDIAELEKSMPKDKQFILKNNIKNEHYFARRGLEVAEGQSPTAFVDEQLKEAQVAAQRKKEGFIGYSQQLEQIDKMQKEIVPIEQYAIKRSAKKMAEVAMHAYQVTKDKDLKKPIFIAPENLFPETGFGSHPQELKKIILESRKEMQTLLKGKGMSEGEAKKLSEQHIKATFDIAHANTWRKYYNKSDKEFDSWMEKQVDDLVKSNVIGHVHLSDNFGYYDEHLAPGQGNAPIGQFLERLQKSGKFKGHIITEPGAQGEGENIFSGMLGSWAQIASSPIYRVGAISKTWSDIEGSYFGRTFSPNVISGQYHINPKGEDNWWSGTPIE